jgi:hypothetical protein
MSSKRSPSETLRAIEESAYADEAERILALSDEDLDRELADEGFDPKAVRARGAELAAKLGIAVPDAARAVEPASAPVAPVALAPPVDIARARRLRRGIWLAAAAMAAVAVLVAIPAVVTMIAKGGEIRPDRWEASAETNEMRAAVLRRDAVRACEEQRWVRCARELDEAKALDPAGEESADVKKARRAIQEVLAPPRVPRGFPDTK